MESVIHRKAQLIVIGVIMLVAATLRFYKLGAVPSSVNADEAAIGYNAYSILKTGKDEYGRTFPLSFQSFDDYKMPAYIYAAIPGISVFGLNDFSVRLPSAIVGTLTVFVTYLLVLSAFHSAPIALCAALLLAISPWHLQFSRSAYEANMAVFFNSLGILFLLGALKKKQLYIPGFLSLALSMWSYHSSRVFVPLIVVGFVVIYIRDIVKDKKYFVFGISLFVVMIFRLILSTVSPEGLVRAKGVSALGNPGLLSRIVSWSVMDTKVGIPFSNIYHNYRLADASTILQGYLKHYDPNFFFSEIVMSKYHAPGVGLMYVWELPVLFFGLFTLGKMKQKGKYLFLLWFCIAPLAAAPTEMLPHPVRTLVFLPTLQIFVAIGLCEIIQQIYAKKKLYGQLAVGVSVMTISVFGAYYFHQYYVHMSIDYAKDWQYGHKEVVDTVKVMQSKFDTVIVSTSLDQPYIFFLYYLRYDPEKYLSYGGTKSGKFDEERNAFDIYEFHTFVKADAPLDPRALYVGTPSEVIPGAERLVPIQYPTGEPAYVLSAEISKENWNAAGNLPYLN
jgi:4-amino-4-deoxy-L-arabinose transferase-like glycosyltransferase